MSVILREANDLLCTFSLTGVQILRFAQNDKED
jgi:hypothetical protein